MDIPDINSRIKQLIDCYANRNVSKFSDMTKIKQQTLNRLFNIDTRTGKYPTATTDILVSITEMLVDVNAYWLLTGRGEMIKQNTTSEPTIIYKSDPKDEAMIKAQQSTIESQKETIETQKKLIMSLECMNKKSDISTDAEDVECAVAVG